MVLLEWALEKRMLLERAEAGKRRAPTPAAAASGQ